ncbi:alpha/beta hydrolase [Thalassotalea sp. LPB0316]|uniref:alpha/beta hydrolase n=1 Tax=Thalassotalea sp. LPB0316 TaxID=2769490 RepID=UPI001867E010|nr:alpha/beta hydrolase [Thalassotalea sp. LPB0316]QOL26056.1 alpha/beta hydrolase [Thalassotalea sp. LPB0316]
MRGTVSQKLAAFLEQVNQAIADNQGVPFEVETTRNNLNNLANLMPQGPAIAEIKNICLKRDGALIPIRIYHPEPTRALPVIVHFHGGGHMCGSVDLYDPISRQLADNCQCIVIAVDYRLAPESPYPTGLNDCEFALRHIDTILKGMHHQNTTILVGDSAGGAICSSLAMKAQDDDSLNIDKQVLIYPSVDYTMSSTSFVENGNGFLLEKEKVIWYFEQYFQTNDTLETRVKASPLMATFSDRLPETLVITAGCDPLRDEGLGYVEALKNAGANCQYIQFDGMIHAYMLLQNLVEQECQHTYQLINQFIHGE